MRDESYNYNSAVLTGCVFACTHIGQAQSTYNPPHDSYLGYVSHRCRMSARKPCAFSKVTAKTYKPVHGGRPVQIVQGASPGHTTKNLIV